MGAEVGDLLQLVDNQSYLGQQLLNVFYYRVTAILGLGGDYLEVLNDYWQDNVLEAITHVQTSALKHNTREWRNLSNGADLYTNSEVIPGLDSASEASSEPSFVSLGFILRRSSLVTRNGYKRFGGLSEGMVSGNTYAGSTTLTDNIASALAGDLNAGVLSVAEPVIVKRPFTVPVGVYQYSSIDTAAFRGVGTQNSRKAGRGI